MSQQHTPIPLPEGTRTRLDEFRRLVWKVKIAEGIAAGLFGLVLSYLLVFLLDRVMDTSPLVRGAILVIGSLGLGIFFPWKLHRWVWSRRQ